LRDELAALLQAGLVVAEGGGLTPRRQKLHQRIAEALEAMPANFAEREPESPARHWFAAGQDGCAEVYWLRSRHRVAHWQEQLDALADYLDADTAEIIPLGGGPGVRKLH
jgi:hypothetical protein